jgi:hypothetical protein
MSGIRGSKVERGLKKLRVRPGVGVGSVRYDELQSCKVSRFCSQVDALGTRLINECHMSLALAHS